MERRPELSEVLNRAVSGELTIPAEVSGAAIQSVLMTVNDLFRLARLAEAPTSGEVHTQSDCLPEIVVPRRPRIFPPGRLSFSELLLIDTPGPNEAGAGLTSVVNDVLSKANMVIVVLDYTQLSNQAAEEMSLRIREFVNLVGSQNLLVLVNKIDQRRRGDRKLERLGDVVKKDLEISDSDLENRLFTVSARWAMVSDRYLTVTATPHGADEEAIQVARSDLLEEDPFSDPEDAIPDEGACGVESGRRGSWCPC